MKERSTYPRFVVVCVRPVSVEFDDVGMFQPGEVVEHRLYFVLLRLEVLALGELNLIPHNFDTLLGVHGEVGAIDAGDIALLHLEIKKTQN